MHEVESSLQRIFAEALEKESPALRVAYLDEACGNDDAMRARVEALLAAHGEAGSFLGGESAGDDPVRERPGTRIGPYEIVEEIGEGAFGVVYVAAQTAPVRRRVALKLVKPGMDTREVLARFEFERQALALMDHPGIARVFDGGATSSGRPYFVMELVPGVAVTSYCDQSRLTVRDRLELFVQVCRAVQHAHQKGVIHRDLKPSNILVTMQDGRAVPKVIDFGVAKATGPEITEETARTRFAQMIGTPEYMSPEQAEMSALDVDTRSDVYALGVLLYELLAGARPFTREQLEGITFGELQRLIREVEPQTPSARLHTMNGRTGEIAVRRRVDLDKLVRALHGDLDWIVMKALEKNRARRYETVSALARDVERHLADEPVEARPPSAAYRLQKFVRRHRTGVAFGTLVLCFLLLAGAAIGWVSGERAARQETLEREAASALARAASAFEAGRLPAAVAAVERAEGLVAGGLSSEGLRRVVRRWRRDLEMVRRLEEVRLESGGDDDGVRADPRYRRVFDWYWPDAPSPDDAVRRIQASAIRSELVAAIENWAIANQVDGVDATALWALLERADADPWRRRLRQQLDDPDAGVLIELAQRPETRAQPPAVQHTLGATLRRGVGAEAAAAFLEEAQRRHPIDLWINFDLAYYLTELDPPQTRKAIGYLRAAVALRPQSAGVHVNLGSALYDLGEWDAAEAAFREAIRLNPDSDVALTNLGNVLRYQRRLDASLEAHRRSVELVPDSALGQTGYGAALDDLGRLEEAVAAHRKAIELAPDFAAAHSNLGAALVELERYEQAAAVLRKAIELDPTIAAAHTNLGNALREQGHVDEAIAAHRRALELDPESLAWTNLGNALAAQGRFAEAADAHRKTIALEPNVWEAHSNLGNALGSLGRFEEAASAHRRAIELAPDRARPRANLGNALLELGRWDEAVEACRQAIDRDPDLLGIYSSLGRALASAGDLDAALDAHREAVERDPGVAGVHSNLGDTLVARGAHEEAIAAYGTALELDPDLVPAHCGLGSALLALERADDAVAAYERALDLAPAFAPAHVGLGDALLARGRLDAAAGAFRRALDLAPRLADAQRGLGDVLKAQNRFDEAVTAYEKAIELNPRLAMAHHNLGVVHAQQGGFHEALALFEKAVELDPDDAMLRYTLGSTLKARGRLEDAVRSLRKATELDPECPAWVNLGNALAQLGRADEAREAYARAVEVQPNAPLAHYNLGNQHLHDGRFDAAIAAFRKTTELAPAFAPGHNNLGAALAGAGRLDDAVGAYRAALAVKPDHVTAHIGLGEVYAQRGDPEKAGASYERALALQPSNPQILNVVAWFLVTADEEVRDPDRAVELARKAAEIAPQVGDLWNTLGLALYRAGRHDDAVAAFERSMELRDGGDVYDWFVLAMAEWQRGRTEEARGWLERAVAWTQENAPEDDVLRRFEAEAQALMGNGAGDGSGD